MLSEEVLLSIASPISGVHPTGEDVKYDPDFEWLSKEFAKLRNPIFSPADAGSPSSESRLVYEAVDWGRVTEVCVDILTSRSKDLRVAVWLCRALVESDGSSGLTVGLKTCLSLMQKFWDQMYPDRIAGRRSTLELLRDQLQDYLQPARAEFAPALTESDLANLEAAVKLIGEIDTLSESRMAGSSVRFTFVESLAVKKAASLRQPAPRVQTESRTQSVSTSSATPVVSASSASTKTYDFAKLSDRDKFFMDMYRSANELHDKGLAQTLQDPVPYQFIRIVYWSPLHYGPDSTIIPPPGFLPQRIAAFEGLAAQRQWLEFVKNAEAAFPSTWFLLDMQRLIVEALGQLGIEYAAAKEAVVGELKILLRRLPSFSILRTSDGTPAASAETRQWLEDLTTPNVSGPRQFEPETTPLVDSIEGSQDVAFDLSASLTENLKLARDWLRQSVSGREAFQIQTKIAEYLIGISEFAMAEYYLDRLDTQIKEHRLDLWDPTMTLRVLRLIFACNKGLAKAKKIDPAAHRAIAEAIIKRVTAIDPVEAASLSRQL
jgi:type VI secretion system protein VasJ